MPHGSAILSWRPMWAQYPQKSCANASILSVAGHNVEVDQPTEQAGSPAVEADELESVVAGTRVVAALIAESLVNLDPSVTMPQWRVLVLADSGECNVSAVADDLGVHMSNATRVCDRLVSAGLLARRRDQHDRRKVVLELTRDGRALFEQAMAYRRGRLEQAMALMDAEEQAALALGMSVLADTLRRARDGRQPS